MLYWIEKFYEMTKKKKINSRVGRYVNSCHLVAPQPLLQKHRQVSATTSSIVRTHPPTPGSHPGHPHSWGTHRAPQPPAPLLGGDLARCPSSPSPHLGVVGGQCRHLVIERNCSLLLEQQHHCPATPCETKPPLQPFPYCRHTHINDSGIKQGSGWGFQHPASLLFLPCRMCILLCPQQVKQWGRPQAAATRHQGHAGCGTGGLRRREQWDRDTGLGRELRAGVMSCQAAASRDAGGRLWGSSTSPGTGCCG